jgi:hypothetical protein
MGQALHPITQAALSFHIWPITGLPAAGGVALPMMEAAVVAARHGVRSVWGAPFLPLALGGAGDLRGGGTPSDRLARWITGATHAKRAALRMLDRLHTWEAHAPEINHGAARLAAGQRTHGRGTNRRQPRRDPAQSEQDDRCGDHSRSHRAGAV